jgi:hypothetical protein
MNRSKLFNILLFLFALNVDTSNAEYRSIAFHYGQDPPAAELQAFDRVVLDPSHVLRPDKYRTPKSEPIAYVSIGEAAPRRGYATKIPQEWYTGENRKWGTRILDQSNREWRSFFISDVIEPLWQQGYRGFFLDTVDSYRLAVPAASWHRQTEGLVAIIKEMKERHPEAKIILNRGFEIVPMVRDLVEGIAAESIFHQWDQGVKRYTKVPDKERAWLINELAKVRRLGIPTIGIDYLPPGDRQLARETANQISSLGIIPWIADHELESLGVGAVEVMPRRILGLYDGSEAADPVFTQLHRLAAMPLNYLGYTLELHDLRTPLPATILTGRYAGIVVWPNSNISGIAQHLDKWLLKRIGEGMRVLFLGEFGFPATAENLAPFGLNTEDPGVNGSAIRIVKQAPDIGFEIPPLPRMDLFLPLSTRSGTPLLQVENGSSQRSEPAAVTEWGGYVLSPYVTVDLPDGQTRWVVNPFNFFRDALRLPEIPVPDTTTENGRRLMMVHVDGDGFIEPPRWGEWKFSGEAAYQEIFSRYRVPTTVSIIEGELASHGLYGNRSAQFEPVARKIFALPWVEIASHSFSHPFVWGDANNGADGDTYHLEIPGYSFKLESEIDGSIEYINRRLAPEGKQCRLFLWTGNCLPGDAALARTGKAGLGNMNGGSTIMTESRKSFTDVAPLGMERNGFFQVYAPNQNENLYTNLWTGPFYGYERVIETFRLTDTPMRIKPIDIYFHFYSASRKDSLNALHKVFDWSLAQPVFNSYASEYVARVMDFNRTVIARSGDAWLVRNGGSLKELRIPARLGYPDMKGSRNIAGFSDYGDSRYVHLGPGGEALLSLSEAPPSTPYLREANAAITGLSTSTDTIRMEFTGNMPLTLSLGGVSGYAVTTCGRMNESSLSGSGLRTFTSPQTRGTLVIEKTH